MVRLRLFGRPRIESASTTLIVPLERRCQLLMALALLGRSVTRDEAASLFWPDHSNRDARRNLRKVLHDVAEVPWAVDTALSGDPIGWSPPTDVAMFERGLANGNLAAALELSTLPLLEGFDRDGGPFSDWLAQQRRRLAERRRRAVLGALNDVTLAVSARISLARQLLAFDPLDEDALAAQLAALREIGAAGEARRAYAAYAEQLAEEMGAEPAQRLRALLQPSHEAMVEPNAFVGRATELAELHALLTRTDVRRLTLLGPGGIGKSRLAKAALATLEPAFADGIVWVPLDDLVAVDAVAPRIAHLAGLASAPDGDASAQVRAWLAPRSTLLVFDNAEHLDALPGFVQTLFDASAHAKLLVTSRRRLALPDECLMPLRGLQLPAADDAAAVLASEAGDLFARRAQQARPGFNSGRAAADVARLTRAVEGMPLAIELAAAWVRVLPVREMAQDIEGSIALLERSDDADERAEHRSLAATFEHSWRLLAPAERRALAALSVFAGPFSRAAAQSVCGASIAMLSALIDRSLLETEETAAESESVQRGEHARFRLHPLLKQFAAAKVKSAADERRDLPRRHAAYFGGWLAELQDAMRGADQGMALSALEQCLPDCRSAWRCAVEQLEAKFVEQAAGCLALYYEARGRRQEGIELFTAADQSFSAAGRSAFAARATLAHAMSTLLYRNGDAALTIDVATRGIDVARQAGAHTALKGCLMNLGLAQWQRAQWAPARACFQEALSLARGDGDLRGVAAFSTSLAMVEQETGDAAAAEAHYREALEINRRLRYPRAVLTTLNNLASLLLEVGRTPDALPLLEEGLRICVEQGIAVMRANFLLGLGSARFALGQLPSAYELTRQALAAAETEGEPHIAVEASVQLARIALASGDLADAQQLARDAVDRALRHDNPPVLLDAISCVAQCRARSCDARGAAAIWLFVAEHALTTESDRRRASNLLESTQLNASDRAWAEQQSRRYELIALAADLARPAVS